MTSPKLISTTLKFGKYSGRTIENIWTGTTETDKGVIIREYLQDFFQIFNGTNSQPKKVTASDSDLEDCKQEINFLQSLFAAECSLLTLLSRSLASSVFNFNVFSGRLGVLYGRVGQKAPGLSRSFINNKPDICRGDPAEKQNLYSYV